MKDQWLGSDIVPPSFPPEGCCPLLDVLKYLKKPDWAQKCEKALLGKSREGEISLSDSAKASSGIRGGPWTWARSSAI